jgi:cystathionine beta-lyase/cystathionine gamma-synthase
VSDEKSPDPCAAFARLDPTGAVVPPLHQASVFAFESTAGIEAYNDDPASHYFYGRYGSPTNDACARAIAALEGTEDAALFSSGMGAVSTAVLSYVGAGDEILSLSSVYGGTLRLFRDLLPRFGVRVSWFDAADAAAAIDAAPAATKVLYFESPSNPILEVVDIATACRAAHARGLTVLFDATFASPINQKSHALGVDVVLHSATKSLGGHADLVAGAAAGPRAAIDRLRGTMKILGTNLDPFAAFLLHRGLRTLAVRIERQNATAMRIAAFLAAHPHVRRALYPGLASHPGHDVARQQMSGFGSIVTLEVGGGFEGARRVVDRLRLFLHAPSLGNVESLVSIPVLTSHHGFSADELARAGVTDAMIRLSIGLEPAEDLIADLDRALSR